MSLSMIGGTLLGFILLLLGVFQGGKFSGKKSAKVDALEDELELRDEYEEIDSAPDLDDPFSRL